jgi:acetoacetyl-CoA synthetase
VTGAAGEPPGRETSRRDRERAAMTGFMGWAGERRGRPFADYDELWRWSVDDLEGFWSCVWEFCGVRASRPYERVLGSCEMPGAGWFEGAELNYAENMLKRLGSGGDRRADRVAVVHCSELRELEELTWGELATKVAAAAGGLRALGVVRGDRVVAYMPNIPEALIAFLAVASIGAIWSSVDPEFGARGVIDRFAQIEPRVLLAVDGHRRGGVNFDRTGVVREILDELPTIEHVVLLGYLSEPSAIGDSVSWGELLTLGEGSPLRFEQVPFDHPLWVLYSSGTTGLPKAIVHGHGGILLEQLKMNLHLELRPGDRMFWFTTTGWMMWNFLVGCLFSEAAIVLYDGSPAYPDFDALWVLVDRAAITCMGVSAALLSSCEKAGVEPGRDHDLSTLRAIGSTGSPLAPESFRWVYEHVGSHVWVFSISGGSDVCTAFLAGCTLLPVYEGELQCRALGCAVESWNEQGHSLIDEVGELVLTQPMPSMPLFFWGDQDGELLRESYFAMYPGVWRHGDWIRITPRGGAVIYGRSDATINREGVRIGTSEIYRAAAGIPEVLDALVLDLPIDGTQAELSMVLFVVLTPGVNLDDELVGRIKRCIRQTCSPRHVPNEVRQIEEVPRTLSGKVLEVPVKRILMGAARSHAVSVDSLANPASLDYFSELAGQLGREATDGGAHDLSGPLAQELIELGDEDRATTVLELALAGAAAALGRDASQDIDADRTFQSLGFDSLSAVDLRVHLGKAVGLTLPWMLVVDHPTPRAVAEFVCARIEEGVGAEQGARSLNTEINAALEVIKRRYVVPRMPPASRAIRIETSPLRHSVLPARLLVKIAARRGRAKWAHSDSERERAMSAMEALIVGTPRGGELGELARRFLIERQIESALFWRRPWSAKVDAPSAARLEAALSGDRGVLLSTCHLGPHYHLSCAAPFRRRETYLVAANLFFDPQQDSYWARFQARLRKGTSSHAVRVDGSFPILGALLARGDAVFVHFDRPGRRATHFLGKSTMLTDGSAQLAFRADALVLPLRARRAGHRVWVDAGAPLDPREFADVDDLHDALAAHHERWILEDPAAMEHPAALMTSSQRELIDVIPQLASAGRLPDAGGANWERRPYSAAPAVADQRQHMPMRADDIDMVEMEDGVAIRRAGHERVHLVNHTAALVLELCDGTKTDAEIADVVGRLYGLPQPPKGEVAACLAQFRAESLVS